MVLHTATSEACYDENGAMVVMLVIVVVVVVVRGEFRPRQTRQLPRAVDLKGRLLSCQSY